MSPKVWWKVKETIFLIHTNFLTMIIISLFYCWRKVFILIYMDDYMFALVYMDDWEKFNETSLPEKKNFTVNQIWKLYAHAKRVCKDFEIKNIGKYHDLYLQSDTLLLSDVFVNLRNISLVWIKITTFFKRHVSIILWSSSS